MSLGSRIVDGSGKKYGARVTSDNALVVATTPYPEAGGTQDIVPFRQYFTDDGTASGSYDMRVDGSTTAQDFYIPANTNGDLYITIISLAISDSSATPAKFGALSALTNGVQILYTSETFGTIYIHDGIKTNFDAIRLGLGNPALGASNDAFRVANVIGNADTYMPIVDLGKFVPPYGIKLSYETSQQLTIRVRDNIAAIDGFDAIAYGFIRLTG